MNDIRLATSSIAYQNRKKNYWLQPLKCPFGADIWLRQVLTVPRKFRPASNSNFFTSSQVNFQYATTLEKSWKVHDTVVNKYRPVKVHSCEHHCTEVAPTNRRYSDRVWREAYHQQWQTMWQRAAAELEEEEIEGKHDAFSPKRLIRLHHRPLSGDGTTCFAFLPPPKPQFT